jgi:hypothetical protein
MILRLIHLCVGGGGVEMGVKRETERRERKFTHLSSAQTVRCGTRESPGGHAPERFVMNR